MEVLAESDQALSARRVYDKIAERLGLGHDERQERHPVSGYVLWDHAVRNAKQVLVRKNLVGSASYNLWSLTEAGRNHLVNAKPGVVITVFVADAGEAIWGEACSVMASRIEDNSVMLHWSSPPYPLLLQKSYGNVCASPVSTVP